MGQEQIFQCLDEMRRWDATSQPPVDDTLSYVNNVLEKIAPMAERLTCWRIYSVIAMLYRIQTDRIKNWISHPKPSGYQALQLTVMGPDCNWVEIQIRSERMHYEAEEGVAAHWKYKQEKKAL